MRAPAGSRSPEAHSSQTRGWDRCSGRTRGVPEPLVTSRSEGVRTPYEAAPRKKLEAGGAKLTAAKSFEVSLPDRSRRRRRRAGGARLRQPRRRQPRQAGTLRPPRSSTSTARAGAKRTELIAVGHRAWAIEPTTGQLDRGEDHARRSPHELDDEQTNDLQGLFEAAEDIDVDRRRRRGRRSATASSSTSPSYSASRRPLRPSPTPRTSATLKIDFEAAIDRKGFLRELVCARDGTGATVTERYDEATERSARLPERAAGPRARVTGVLGRVAQARPHEAVRDGRVRGSTGVRSHFPVHSAENCELTGSFALSRRWPRQAPEPLRATPPQPRAPSPDPAGPARAPRARWSSPRGRRGRR